MSQASTLGTHPDGPQSAMPAPTRADGGSHESWQSWLRQCASHLRSLIYLKRTLAYRRWEREPLLGRIILAIFFAVFASGAMFAVFIAGIAAFFLYSRVSDPMVWTFAWNVIVGVFLFAWFINISSDIQRNETISMDRLMHLPISPTQAFTLNYLWSWLNLPMIYFVATSVGMMVGGAIAQGPKILLGAIPLVAYLLVVTALTSQLQILVASWMANPRTRRWMVMLIPILIGGGIGASSLMLNRWVFVEVIQRNPRPTTPAMAEPATTAIPESLEPEMAPPALPSSDSTALPASESTALPSSDPAGETAGSGNDAEQKDAPEENAVPETVATPEVLDEEATPTVPRRVKLEPFNAQFREAVSSKLRWLDRCFPPMWFAACMDSLHRFVPDLLWMVPVMLAVSVWSLRANYRLTLRMYQNGVDNVATAANPNIAAQSDANASASAASSDGPRWMERSFWGMSDVTSAIVAQTWLSSWRAPEMKLQLLFPLLQPAVFVFVLSYWKSPGEMWQTLGMVGAAVFGLYTSSGFLGNMFGLDRAGFRAWVLSPVPRAQILEGRNLAFGIPAWALAIVVCVSIGILWRVPPDKVLLACLSVTTFVPLYLLLTNCMSILSPFGLPQGTITPKHFSWKNVLISLLLSTVIPALLAWSLCPLGLEILAKWLWPAVSGWPIGLLLAPIWVVGSWLAYRAVLPSVGKLFESWELTVLKTVVAQEQ